MTGPAASWPGPIPAPYTPHGEDRFDIGGATAAAFTRPRREVPAEEAGAIRTARATAR